MSTAKEYFKKLFSKFPSAVLVFDDESMPVAETGAETISTALLRQLPPSFDEAKKLCCEKEEGVSFSHSFGYQSVHAHLAPYPYGGRVYAVAFFEKPGPMGMSAKEHRRVLQNTQGLLNEQLNNIYGAAEIQGIDSKLFKLTGQSVRRILRMSRHLRQVMQEEEHDFYTVRANLSSFAFACASSVQQFLPEAPLFAAESAEVLAADIMPEDSEQVFYALVSNGLRFCQTQVRVWAERKDGEVCIVVEDDGSGVVDPERILEMGNSASDRNGKTGLGCSLALCARLMARQNGRLEYTRWNDKTRFIMVFPAASDVQGGRMAEWKAEPTEDLLSQARIEMSDVYEGF